MNPLGSDKRQLCQWPIMRGPAKKKNLSYSQIWRLESREDQISIEIGQTLELRKWNVH